NNSPASLVGERRRGLIKYTMWLMNSARLGIAAQALGIAEAAWREASKYANERVQFGTAIKNFPPVFEMLTEGRVAIEAGRSLLYETARFVDLKEGLEHASEAHPERSSEIKAELKKYTRLASLFTPLVKAYNTEMANRVCDNAIQVHGGTGYMKDFSVERHYRDARITNIYEGTTQLQVVAAIGGITSGVATEIFDDYDREDYSHAVELFQRVKRIRNMLEKAIVHLKGLENEEAIAYHARRLVEMSTAVIQGYLLLRDAAHAERKMHVARLFIDRAAANVEMNLNFILNAEQALVRHHTVIIEV
ncbi:MAG: acyl-CoA dehydrogenase family protein, partial [Spirochaetaceae bacterium]|nr:acyl-CoA dehydrogenase family protein [Spirochaetaceae bacterium]